MATRKKKVIISGVSRETADEAFATYAKSDAENQCGNRTAVCQDP